MTSKRRREVQKAEESRLLDILQAKDGVLSLGPDRVVLLTETAYALLLRVVHEHAPHIVKYAFYDMGYRAGQQFMEALRERADDPERAFRYFVETYRQTGYGDIEVVSFDLSKPEATLRARNLFETAVARRADIYRSPRTVDHYSRGMFAGFMSALVGREVVCEEMACEYRGDEACEFVILPFER